MCFRLKREQESLDNIKQYYVRCRSEEEKYQAIQNIYGSITIGQAIIFCHVSMLIRRKIPRKIIFNFKTIVLDQYKKFQYII